MQTHAQREAGARIEPGDVRANGGRLDRTIIAIQIDAVLVLAPVEFEPFRVQARDEPDIQMLGPLVLLKKLQHGQWTGRFIAMNAGGDINVFLAAGRVLVICRKYERLRYSD